MSREFKHYQLRAARKPASLGNLSSVVVVTNDEGEHGFCYVTFTDALEKAAGQKLPRGVSKDDPAYLHVIYAPRTRTWDIWALYLKTGIGVTLWKTEHKPEWLNFFKESCNGPNQTADGASRSPSTSRRRASRARAPEGAEA